MLKRNIGPIILIIVLFITFVIALDARWRRTQELQGQWSQFNSQDHYQTKTFPAGFSLDYPSDWTVFTHRKGKPQSPDLRTRFTKPDNLFFSNTRLSIFWRRVDAEWTLDDSRSWFFEDIAPIGISNSELERKRDQSFRREITVGKDKYPALTQAFVEFSGPNPRRQVILLVVGDESFALSLHSDDFNEETEQIFERMIDSLEVYE